MSAIFSSFEYKSWFASLTEIYWYQYYSAESEFVPQPVAQISWGHSEDISEPDNA